MLGRGRGFIAHLPARLEYHMILDRRLAKMQHAIDPVVAAADYLGAVQPQHEEFGRLGAQHQPLPQLVRRQRIQLRIAWIVDLNQVLETQLHSPDRQ
jgi:hypothetical protein